MTRGAVVIAARGWLGTPYHHGASLRGVGCDCLGLLRGVWRELVGPEPVPVPPYRAGWVDRGGGEALLAAACAYLVPAGAGAGEAGDVLLFRWRDGLPATHCAILTGADAMIHAHDGAVVAEVAVSPWWRRHLAGTFAFPGVSP